MKTVINNGDWQYIGTAEANATTLSGQRQHRLCGGMSPYYVPYVANSQHSKQEFDPFLLGEAASELYAGQNGSKLYNSTGPDPTHAPYI